MLFKYERKNINFYITYNKKSIIESENFKRNILIAVPIGLILIVLLTFLTIQFKIWIVNKETEELRSYTKDPANMEKYAEATYISNKVKLLASEMRTLNRIKSVLSSYPQFNSTQISRIYGNLPASARITDIAYDSQKGTVTIDVAASLETYAPMYVKRLRSTKIFKKLIYYGYNGGEKGYTFQVTGVLKGGNER